MFSICQKLLTNMLQSSTTVFSCKISPAFLLWNSPLKSGKSCGSKTMQRKQLSQYMHSSITCGGDGLHLHMGSSDGEEGTLNVSCWGSSRCYRQVSLQSRKIKSLPLTCEDSPHKEVSTAPLFLGKKKRKKASREFQVHRALRIPASEGSHGTLHGHSCLSFILRELEIL